MRAINDTKEVAHIRGERRIQGPIILHILEEESMFNFVTEEGGGKKLWRDKKVKL